MSWLKQSTSDQSIMLIFYNDACFEPKFTCFVETWVYMTQIRFSIHVLLLCKSELIRDLQHSRFLLEFLVFHLSSVWSLIRNVISSNWQTSFHVIDSSTRYPDHIDILFFLWNLMSAKVIFFCFNCGVSFQAYI